MSMESTFKIDDFDSLLSDLQSSLTPLESLNPGGSSTKPTATLPTPAPAPQAPASSMPPRPSTSQPPATAKVPLGRGRGRTNSRSGSFSARRESKLIKPDPAVLAQAANKLICAKCNQPVSGVYITALDKIWHQDHFNCAYCSKNLEGTFFETDSGIICEPCAMNVFKCSECSKPITGQHLVFDDGRTVHTHCVPQRPCFRCKQPIMLNDAHVEALDQYWHPEHFTCNRCNAKLPAQFVQLNNNPYCMACIDALQKEKNIVISIQQ